MWLHVSNPAKRTLTVCPPILREQSLRYRHPERSEGSRRDTTRSFASLRMTRGASRQSAVKDNPSQRGFLLVAAIITILLMGTISLALVETVKRESEILNAGIEQDKAAFISHAGMAAGVKYMSQVGNWLLAPSTLYNLVSYAGGTYTVTVSNKQMNSATLTAVGKKGDASFTHQQNIVIDSDPNYPGYLMIDTGSMDVSGNDVDDIDLENMRLYDDITLDKIRITSPANSSNDIEKISIRDGGWQTLWSGTAAPGTLIDFINRDIDVSDSDELWIEFDNNVVKSGNITIEIHLSDGSIYAASEPLN